MINQEIHITYEEYHSLGELNPGDRELVTEAIQAMQGAYAPYSHFHVGAAVRMSNGQLFLYRSFSQTTFSRLTT